MFIEKLLPKELYSVLTHDITGNLLNIMHKEATKAKAVSRLADIWGITPQEIISFGDELNDIDMLNFTGIGIAVSNALSDVKAVAKFAQMIMMAWQSG